VPILTEIGVNIIDPLLRIWDGIISTVPGVVAAIIILVVGYLIAWVIGYVIDKALTQIKLDKWILEKTHMQKIIGSFRLTHFLAVITRWYVFILFLPPAAGLIQLQPLSTFLLSVALWIPNVILAVIIGIVGLMAAHYTEWKILETKAKTAQIIAYLAKIVIVIFTLLIVLDQIGVKIAIAQTSFLIILSGVMLAIALMIGIGFGSAFKEEAKKIIKDVKKKI
jgi:small-conductance mechanosensitive channel